MVFGNKMHLGSNNVHFPWSTHVGLRGFTWSNKKMAHQTSCYTIQMCDLCGLFVMGRAAKMVTITN